MAIKKNIPCPRCGGEIESYRNPVPTVDIIIEMEDGGIILIKRKRHPVGWAIPGGFVGYGESLEEAALREAREETSLEVILTRQMHTYSAPDRDPRQHTITTAYIAKGSGVPAAADDAAAIGIFRRDNLPRPLMFDHVRILKDYFEKYR